MKTIRLNKVFVDNREVEAVKRIMKIGKLSGGWDIERKIEEQLKDILKVKHIILTPSCTHALEMAMMTLGIKEGDEVILPSFNYVSTANAILRQGAKPIFVDILADTLNIDPHGIERKVTKNTKAIVPMHYAGISCDMEGILSIAKKHSLFVIEDAAQAFGSKYKGKFLGTIGDIGCYSFHETKNMTCGEGGVFVTDNHRLVKRAEIIRENGTNRKSFLRGEVDKYTWINCGSNFRLSAILTVIMGEQLKKFYLIQNKRKEIFNYYFERIEPLEREGKVILPKVPKECEPNWHIFYFRVKNEFMRNSILKKMKSLGIGAAFHFIPLHSSPFGKYISTDKKISLPITDYVSKTLIRLPLYPTLKRSDQDFIISTIYKIIKRR